jgi:hypothetical protein
MGCNNISEMVSTYYIMIYIETTFSIYIYIKYNIISYIPIYLFDPIWAGWVEKSQPHLVRSLALRSNLGILTGQEALWWLTSYGNSKESVTHASNKQNWFLVHDSCGKTKISVSKRFFPMKNCEKMGAIPHFRTNRQTQMCRSKWCIAPENGLWDIEKHLAFVGPKRYLAWPLDTQQHPILS